MRTRCRTRWLAGAAAFAIAASAVRPVEASTATATMAITATALAVCVVAATPMVFGNYAQVALPASATLAVTCSPGTTYTVALNAGTTTGATTSNRLMLNAVTTTTLAYSLYTDAGHTSPWTSNTVAGTGTGLAQTINVYGLIAANLDVAPGAYADVVTATVTY